MAKKKIVKKPKKNNNLHQLIFDSARDGIFIIDKNGNYLDVNPAGCAMFGYSAKEFLNANINLLAFEEDIDEARKAQRQEMIESGSGPIELRLRKKDGSEIWVEMTTDPFLVDGERRVLGIKRDISKRRISEENVRFQANLLANVSDAIFSVDMNSNITSWNKGAENMYGIKEDEIIGKNLFDELKFEFFEEVTPEEVIQEVITNEIWKGEGKQYLKNGETIYLQYSISLIKDEKGNPIGRVTVNRDITERKKVEDTLAYQASLLENVSDAIISSDLDFNIVTWNKGAEKMYGWRADEVIGKPVGEATQIEYPNKDRDEIIEAYKDKGAWEGEIIQKKKDGTPLNIYSKVTTVLDNSDKPIGTVGINRDITAQKRVELALQESRSQFQDIIKNSLSHVILKDLEGRYILVNPAFEKDYGLTNEEIIGKTIYDFFPKERADEFWQEELKVIKTGQPVTAESSIEWGGETRNSVTTKFPLFDSDGKPYAIGILSMDITGRVRNEEALHTSRAQFQSIVENSQSNISVKDLEGHYTLVNPAFLKNYNITNEDIIGKTNYDLFPKEKADELLKEEQKILKTLEPISSESEIIWEGETRNIIQTIFPLLDNEGKPYAICIIGLEITERVKAEKALKESKNRFQDIVENSQTRITVKDLEGRYILVNPAFEKQIGISSQEIIGKTAHDFLPKKKADKLWDEELNVLKTGTPIISEITFERQGRTRYGTNTKFPLLDGDGKPYAVCILGLDLTERVEAELKLQEYSEKLELLVEERTQELQDTRENLMRKENLALLGALTGSLSHDLRNPLTGISNAVYYLKTILADPDAKVAEYLNIISNSVQEADKIIQNLRELLQTDLIDKENVKVSNLVSSALEITPTPDNIQVITKFSPKIPQVYVDSTQMQHVIDNLLNNAYQAMPEGGTIIISGEKKGGQVLINFEDNGCGISEENKMLIFEPLFTTKETGMGIGLAVSKVIIEANGGNIGMQSELGKGSTFTLSLPRDLSAE